MTSLAKTFKTSRYKVWRYIRTHGGCTDKEICAALKMNKNTARPRRIELEHANLVELVFPLRKDHLGNVSERWRATALPYPAYWPSPRAGDGSALVLRAARRVSSWAATRGDVGLLGLAKRLETAVLKEVHRRGMQTLHDKVVR